MWCVKYLTGLYYYFCSRSACVKCLCKSSLWGVFSKFRKYIFNLLFLQQYIEHLGNLRHIEIKKPGCAEFEFEMDLKDPNAKIFLLKVKQYTHFWWLHFAKRLLKTIYKTYPHFLSQDGVLVPFTFDTDEKHSLRQVGRKFIFSVRGLSADDAGLYQVDIEGVNVFSTDFKSEL